MSTKYNAQYSPPIPILQVSFASETRAKGPLSAIVDTGADTTIIPESLALELNATPLNPAQIRTQWGEVHPVTIYLLDLHVNEVVLPGIVAAGDPQGSEIILGRNVLNRLALFLDGSKLEVSILDDATVARLRARR